MFGVIEVLMGINRSKLYARSWYLWFGQNLLLFLSTFLFIGTYFSLLVPDEAFLYHSLSSILNVTVFIALSLDLVVIAVITFISFLEGLNALKKSQNEKLPFIITGCGFMWIVTSLLWRFPFYLRGPLDFGFEAIGPFTLVLHYDIHGGWFFLFFISGSIFLFFFLVLQDKYFLPSGSSGRKLYGLTILIGNLSIAIYRLFYIYDVLIIPNFINLTLFYWIFILLWKLIVTTLLGMIVAKKIFKEKAHNMINNNT